ncbi:MAG: ECF RNA polymerase sigma factor SigK [Acidimicrobiales bacterium]|nr:ECF RNA polymerase sigma factor SigK [Acidimicrobiales bacterium]
MNPLRRLRAVDPPDAEADLMTDALREAGRGSEAAFGRFYESASALVYGTVLRVVRDRAMAEEVAQEVFVELWRLAPRFDAGKGTARAWATTIAHRRAVDRVRSEQSRRDREDRDNQTATIEYDSVSEQVGDSLERERVRRALIDLSDTQREAVTLAYYGGHTYREVAVLLDVAEGTAKTRIRDGLIKLRDTMGVTS